MDLENKTESTAMNSEKSVEESNKGTKIRQSHSFEMPKEVPKTDKKRYDREFLMKIKYLVTEKPEDLPQIPNVTIDGVSFQQNFIFHI